MSSKPPHASLFQVYLRLRPPMNPRNDENERFLTVETPQASQEEEETPVPAPTHITLQPPNDTRKRAIEKFGFTKVFEEHASQLDVFQDTGMESIVRGVLREGRDGLVATLGVTGSGKSHTILGSKSERGMTQMALDVIFRSIETARKSDNFEISPMILASLTASDHSESQLFSAQSFLDAVYGDHNPGRSSRAPTPMSPSRANTPSTVRSPKSPSPQRRAQMKPENPSSHDVPEVFPIPGDKCQLWPHRTSTHDRLSQFPIDTPSKVLLSRPENPNTISISFACSKNVENRFTKSSLCVFQEPTPALIFPRRQPRERALTSPRLPIVSHLAVDLSSNAEYVVLVSMYEVYNDRIFDLLSPSFVSSQGNAMSRGNAQKDRRRPLLFKPTEGSPDRKLVAGLRKIACSSYEDALAILDVGLTERKVTGTGANSVSSRSHGFFCLEVKKMASKRNGEMTWSGNTLTVVDLAGSERARTAKTAGATLAEAGKINESLMYLGQCLQMQSNLQDGVKTALVPYRQCKLTELLFSNSFPSSNQMSRGQYPQKAIMIVTADPLGDYNATSQILRYSALAREVTVPRVPSLAGSIASVPSERGRSISGRISPNDGLTEELERAFAEIARLTKDCHNFAIRLAEEEIARSEAEHRLQAAEDRCVMIEQEVREECWADMEEQVEAERRRWQAAWDEQIGRHDDLVDKKIELVSRGFDIYEDPQSTTHERIEELESENVQLRRRLATLEREMSSQSPTRKPRTKQLPASPKGLSNGLGRASEIENAMQRVNQLNITDAMFSQPSPMPKLASPGKKLRKVSTRKWDLAPENEL